MKLECRTQCNVLVSTLFIFNSQEKLLLIYLWLNPMQNLCHTIADNILVDKFMSKKLRFHKPCLSSYEKQKLPRKKKQYDRIQKENKRQRIEE